MKAECLVLPHDPTWNEARRAWNLAVDQRPAAVALPESAEEVAAVLRWARTRSADRAAEAHVEVVRAAMAPWDAGRDYLNFTERRERGERLFGEMA